MSERQPRVLVTGANGFVGHAVVSRLLRQGSPVTAAGRREIDVVSGVTFARVGDIGPVTNWSDALEGCSAVVHCAARVHVMHETASNPLYEYRKVNVEGSLALAKQAEASGVRRFVFISSVKVNGESTIPDNPYRATDVPQPVDAYGTSKLEAEEALRHFALDSRIDLVIIRPPMVYGPGVKANFLRLAQWIARGLPLPFGSLTTNRRSFLAVENLADLVSLCVGSEAAAGRVFLASDGEDLSTADLVQRMGAALGVAPRLVHVPAAALAASARLLGRGDLWQRFAGNLQVDSGDTRKLLNWRPPLSVNQGLTSALASIRGVSR